MCSDRVSLVSVPFALGRQELSEFCALMSIAAWCWRTFLFMQRAQTHFFDGDLLRQRLRDSYRRSLVVYVCVIVLYLSRAHVVAIASFN